MKHIAIKPLFFLIIIAIISSCSTNPYKASEKSYKEQLENYKKIISNMEAAKLETSSATILPSSEAAFVDPLVLYKDTLSVKAPVVLSNGISTEWISTVNFNLRKPNFIINYQIIIYKRLHILIFFF